MVTIDRDPYAAKNFIIVPHESCTKHLQELPLSSPNFTAMIDWPVNIVKTRKASRAEPICRTMIPEKME